MAEAEGFVDVRTYIQSGNLVFASDASAKNVKDKLERRLEDYAGKPVGVIVRTADEIRQVLRANPFPDAAPNKVGVLFLDQPPDSETVKDAKGQRDEEIQLGVKEIFIHFPTGMGSSKLRLSAMSQGTMRNINTVTKLVQMAT